MRAARAFAAGLVADGFLARVASVRVELFGSLAATGRAHGSEAAVLLGLEGETPEHVDVDSTAARVAKIREQGRLALLGSHELAFGLDEHLVFNRRETMAAHPNGMRFSAFDADGACVATHDCYSIGGGFVASADELALGPGRGDDRLPLPFSNGAELLGHCEARGLSVSGVMRENELVWRSAAELDAGLDHLWAVMGDCVEKGCTTEGELPGFLHLKRRAPELAARLRRDGADGDPLRVLDWVNLFALAVSEENAAGGRIVTAPTNGAAGIIPAVLHYYRRFLPGSTDEGVRRFLLGAGAVALLCKHNASISGAEVGCQGEVGSASAMAAAGLAEVCGASPAQVENAAEIGIEHNLGLTCDPVGGLVQVPCIERNAMGAVKAINAARMALAGDGTHVVSLDKVLETMRQTGADMKTKYKETSRGGLAVNITEC